MARPRRPQSRRPTVFEPGLRITVSAERFDRLQKALAAPAKPIPALTKLFADPGL